MKNNYYDGERIYFRPLELSDTEQLCGWFNNPEIWRTLKRFQPMNALREREFIEKLYTDRSSLVLGIVVKDGDRLIGCCGLMNMGTTHQSATYGVGIGDSEYQSRGFGTDTTRLICRLGFEEYNLHRIELSVLADNVRGIRCYERVGFVKEGVFRDAYFRNGRFVDAWQYSLLRPEWQAAQSGSGGDS